MSGLDPYIGSTTQSLCKRLVEHRSQKKRFEAGNLKHKCCSGMLVGFEDVQITLVEEIDCINKEQLLACERKWFDVYKNINKNRPSVTAEEALAYKIAYEKNYREINRDRIRARDRIHSKIYYQLNKDKILEQKKNYYQSNKLTSKDHI